MTYKVDTEEYSQHIADRVAYYTTRFAEGAALTFRDQQGLVGSVDYPTVEDLRYSCEVNMHDTLDEYGYYGDWYAHDTAQHLFDKLIQKGN